MSFNFYDFGLVVVVIARCVGLHGDRIIQRVKFNISDRLGDFGDPRIRLGVLISNPRRGLTGYRKPPIFSQSEDSVDVVDGEGVGVFVLVRDGVAFNVSEA